jgi:hypothetical protein
MKFLINTQIKTGYPKGLDKEYRRRENRGIGIQVYLKKIPDAE